MPATPLGRGEAADSRHVAAALLDAALGLGDGLDVEGRPHHSCATCQGARRRLARLPLLSRSKWANDHITTFTPSMHAGTTLSSRSDRLVAYPMINLDDGSLVHCCAVMPVAMAASTSSIERLDLPLRSRNWWPECDFPC